MKFEFDSDDFFKRGREGEIKVVSQIVGLLGVLCIKGGALRCDIAQRIAQDMRDCDRGIFDAIFACAKLENVIGDGARISIKKEEDDSVTCFIECENGATVAANAGEEDISTIGEGNIVMDAHFTFIDTICEEEEE